MDADTFKCRRCSGCRGAEHHWLEGFPFYGCKHCEAQGVACPVCDAAGTPEPDAENPANCETCRGFGVIQVLLPKEQASESEPE